jgi:GH25 family lysozyme M1 (1,4-beta-N-acetylmuramidase)
VAIYQNYSNKQIETVAEAETETEAEIIVAETEVAETVYATEIIDIPTFVSCAVSGDSIEKDLTLYVKGADKKKISGQQFEIKLISPNDKSKLTDALAAIDDVNAQIEALNSEASEDADTEKKDTSDTASNAASSVSSTTGSGTLTIETEEETTESAEGGEKTIYISSVTGEEVTDEESLLYAKKQAIEAYAEVLASMDGDTYTDSDSDGMIYIDSITEGDYLACLVPAENYDPENYTVKVNVKEKIEYQAVENIEDKTVSEAKAGDVEETHEDVVVEETLTDTVEWVDSKAIPGETIYKSAKAAALTASVSNDKTTSTAKKSDGTEKDPSETETTETSSGTESQTTESQSSEPQTGSEPAGAAEEVSLLSGNLTAAKRFSLLRGYGLFAANANEKTSVEATESTLSIPASATVYSDVSGADTVAIAVTSSGVTDLKESVSGNLTVSGSNGSYTLKASGVTSDQTATLTVSGTDCNGETISVACSVTIMGSSNQLTDSAGHKLFMDATGKTAATYKDYSASATYYYASEETASTYYGWQTINGIRYYYDKNGNRVTGTQVITGNTYNFGSDGALLTSGYGIDVSKWQGSIDWSQAKSAVSFAIIRAGFRGSNGAISVDSYAGTNIKNAKANGVKVGLYVYSRAINEVQAVEEASLAISVAKQYGGISLPIYIDMEADNQKSLSTAQRDAIVIAFCKTVKNAGYQAGVYANKNWLTNYLTPSSYTGYSIWCAQYNTSCTYGGRYDIWQYSSKGTIPGINGNVDLDQSFF